MTDAEEKRLQSVLDWFLSRKRDINTGETDDQAVEYLYNLIGEIEDRVRNEERSKS